MGILAKNWHQFRLEEALIFYLGYRSAKNWDFESALKTAVAARSPQWGCQGRREPNYWVAHIMRLLGKNAIITGAASGLGAGIAAGFIREGAKVLLTDVDDRKGMMLAAELAPEAEYLHLDVTSEEDWRRGIEHFVRLDIVVNNAGITSLGSIDLRYRCAMGT